MSSGERRGSVWRRIFPAGPDFLGLLGGQAAHGRRALDAFFQWCEAPSEAGLQLIFQIETEADDVRRHLVMALQSAFSTPLDREDLNDLSQRFDDIVDAVRNSAREVSALRVTPDDSMRSMIHHLNEGLEELQLALGALTKGQKGHDGALHHCAKAHYTGRLNERIYTQAMSTLLEAEDFRHIFRQREAYGLMVRLSELVELTAEKLAHAVNKVV